MRTIRITDKRSKPDIEAMIADAIANIPQPEIPEIPQPIDNKPDVEELGAKVDDKLKEIKEELSAVRQMRGAKGWGAHGLTIQDGGSTVDKVNRYLNFIGATVTRNRDGVVDIDVSSPASSGLVTMTGTIDDSNTSFTASATPTLVNVNGTFYRDGKGVTISGTSITLDNPVGTGGDIYGLK